MKIIFLDIDGVLNNQIFYSLQKHEEYFKKTGKTYDIDKTNVEFLNNIIKETGAKVVISSTWRIGKSVQELQNILNEFGFIGEVIGVTPNLKTKYSVRGNEILGWIEENIEHPSDFREYVILDDDSDMLYWQRHNFLLVDGYVGLTPNIAYKATRILNGL